MNTLEPEGTVEMKLTTFSVEIAAPIDRVVPLFADNDNLGQWQTGFVRYDAVSGTPGTVGAVTRVCYRGVDIVETITSIEAREASTVLRADYEHRRGPTKVMMHRATHRFSSPASGRTRYDFQIDETQFFGVIPKLLSRFMSGMVGRHYQAWLDQFKGFAERSS